MATVSGFFLDREIRNDTFRQTKEDLLGIVSFDPTNKVDEIDLSDRKIG